MEKTKQKRKKSGGRQAGTPNKTTANIKAVLEEAFERLGGVDFLHTWASENPGEFLKIWSKLIPRDTVVEATHHMTLEELVAGANE
ncbi:MAG: hypothetical protein VB050_13240 [Geobacteraceae bacterium]|nr:hypothetical protein [Geobacteraceae bacterium]